MDFSPISQVLNDPLLVRYLLLQADYDTILIYCSSHSLAHEIYKDEVFWIHKAQHDFNITPNDFRITNLSSVQRYIELLTRHGKITAGSENFITFNEFTKRAIRQDRNDLVQYIIKLGFETWKVLTYEYFRKGIRSIEYLDLSKDYNLAAMGALRGNRRELFDYVLLLSPSDYKYNFNALICSTLFSKNIQLVDYVLSLVPSDYILDYNLLTAKAIRYVNIPMFNHIRSLVSSLTNYNYNWNFLIEAASSSQSLEKFDYVRSLLPSDYNWNYDSLAKKSLKTGSKQLFDHIRSLVPNYKWNYNSLASVSLYQNSLDLFNYVCSLVSSLTLDYEWNFYSFAKSAAKTGNRELFIYISSLTSRSLIALPLEYYSNYNLNKVAANAIRSGNQPLISYVFSWMPPNYWNYNKLIIVAIKCESKRMFDLIRSLAPSDHPWNYKWLAIIAGYRNEQLTNHIRSLIIE